MNSSTFLDIIFHGLVQLREVWLSFSNTLSGTSNGSAREYPQERYVVDPVRTTNAHSSGMLARHSYLIFGL